MLSKRKDYEPEIVIDGKIEAIWDVLYTSFDNELLVGILCHSENGIYLIWWVLAKEKQITLQKLHIRRDERQLQSYLLHTSKKDGVQLITLCMYIPSFQRHFYNNLVHFYRVRQ